MNVLSFYRQNGVTLMELMITMAILGIVITIVVPSAQSILIQNRIVGEINEVSAVVQFARATAIDEQTDTIVCPSTNFSTCTENWDNPKMVFADLDGDGERSDDEELLVGTSAISSANDLSGPDSPIRFQANGAVSSPSSLVLCHKDKEDKYARAITVSLQGRVRSSQDTDGDSVYEDNSGNALDCN